jgi:hypothetical protein
MTWLWIAAALVAVVVGMPLLVGALTAREHVASIAQTYRATPQQIWAAITGHADMANWREGVSRVEVLEPVGGKRRVREHTSFGSLTYELEVEEPPRKLVDQGFGGAWTFEITEDPAGAELRITERGYVDNLLFRFLARWVFGHERTIRAYHRSLQQKLGE